MNNLTSINLNNKNMLITPTFSGSQDEKPYYERIQRLDRAIDCQFSSAATAIFYGYIRINMLRTYLIATHSEREEIQSDLKKIHEFFLNFLYKKETKHFDGECVPLAYDTVLVKLSQASLAEAAGLYGKTLVHLLKTPKYNEGRDRDKSLKKLNKLFQQVVLERLESDQAWNLNRSIPPKRTEGNLRSDQHKSDQHKKDLKLTQSSAVKTITPELESVKSRQMFLKPLTGPSICQPLNSQLTVQDLCLTLGPKLNKHYSNLIASYVKLIRIGVNITDSKHLDLKQDVWAKKCKIFSGGISAHVVLVGGFTEERARAFLEYVKPMAKYDVYIPGETEGDIKDRMNIVLLGLSSIYQRAFRDSWGAVFDSELIKEWIKTLREFMSQYVPSEEFDHSKGYISHLLHNLNKVIELSLAQTSLTSCDEILEQIQKDLQKFEGEEEKRKMELGKEKFYLLSYQKKIC